MKSVVENRRWGGWLLAPLRLVIIVALWVPLPIAIVFALQISNFANSLPPVPDLEELRPKFASRVETVDGWFLGGSRVTREVPFHELPPHVIAAVVAAEDEGFFTHQAFSFRAIVRAALQNYRFGKTVQGASTITQQVARQFLTREKSYDRKIKELLVARRLEANYPKLRILEAYVGGVFWGHTAHGVTQAAHQYFGKSPRDLTLGEAATLAGILPAPSKYSPLVSVENAQRERDRVLRRMVSTGMISDAEADEWTARPVEPRPPGDEALVVERMPRAYRSGLRFITEHGKDAWSTGGMTAVVPHERAPQALARRALRQAVQAVDHRQGWRGPLGRALPERVAEIDTLLQRQEPARYSLARVSSVEADTLQVMTRGGSATVTLDARSDWAEPADTGRHYKHPVQLRDFGRAVAVHDIVLLDFVGSEMGRGGKDADPLLDSVIAEPTAAEPSLAQLPVFEGALVAIESQTGRLLAAVGGVDSDTDAFDRAFQGCRQPGSVFKPVVYAEALSRNMTAATMLSDVPTEVATGRGDVWRPRNADRDFKGFVTLADALAWSRNIPTVNLMDQLGPRSVVNRAKRLGATESRLDNTSSVSLGASCLRPYEVTQIYAAFQRKGRAVGVGDVAFWYDHRGAARDDTLHFGAHDWRVSARIARIARVGPVPDRAISENVSYIMGDLLRRVVTNGTASKLPDEWLVAGKTGTTNDYDAWFVGFDRTQTVATWVGADHNLHPLGRGEHGATVAMPAFAAYYEAFARQNEDGVRLLGEPPAGIEYIQVDRATGLLTRPGEWGQKLPFVVGSAPRDLAPSKGTRQAQQIDELIYDF